VPKVTNHLVIQQFRLMGRNDFVIAPNTPHSKHEHRRSFLHRGQQAYIRSLNADDLPRGHGGNVTASVAINHVSLSFAHPCDEVVYCIVGHVSRITDHLAE
jgi:hypothetical protein